MSQSTAAERRRSSRFDKAFPVYLSSHEGIWRGIARNISEGGIFIETRDPHPLKGQLTICFADERAGIEMSAKAEVRYQCVLEYGARNGTAALRGMGLRFLGFLDEGESVFAAPVPAAALPH
ncbi:PilZ domain-containing protein [Vulgatibacter sp.]|uniref:PilZ domain-containing protein n=1 Tax=Vulgatibacter sp. TaxID=1971226 RepID=UPI0035612A04